MDEKRSILRIFLICLLLTSGGSAQSIARSILFTNPKLDPQRCSQLFSAILKKKEFASLPVDQIEPLFLKELRVPASTVELQNQLNIIKDDSIFVEIGPTYFYGPSFFPPEWKTNGHDINRTRIEGFDLSFDVKNKVIEAAFKHITSNIAVVQLAYIFDESAEELNPFTDIDTFKFLRNTVGRFYVYRMRDFADYEDLMSKILIDGANVLVLNVEQRTTLKLLRKAEEKNVLQQPFYWLVFNAGVTLSGEDFYVVDTNFYAVEFSTNGELSEYPEMNAISRPITPQDLIFRDMAVVGLQKLAQILQTNATTSIPLITCTLTDPNNTNLEQIWNFYSYMDTKFDSRSLHRVQISTSGVMNSSFQSLKPPPTRENLLNRMRYKPLRLGTIVVPPLITNETGSNGSVVLSGPEIVVAKELMRRLNVLYEIVVFDSDVGERVDGRWTGVFGRLEEWDVDLLVGPLSASADRLTSFQGSGPIRSIAFKYMYHRPSLKASLQIFQFVVAFHGYTWLLIFITAVVFGVALALLHKISPNILSYSIHPAMIFVFGYLVQGVRTRPPSQLSSQILIVVWWFFCLILVIAFCANYAAYRSFTALQTLPTTVSSLLHQDYYSYAYIRVSNTELQMKTSLDPNIYALYKTINTKFKDLVPPNREVGIQQALEGGFALLDESPFIDYYSRKYCLETSSALWYGAYVFYMPKLLPYYQLINDEIALMAKEGVIDRIFKAAESAQTASLPTYCGATFKDQAIEAMRNPLVKWSDYSIEFAAAFGVFIVSLIGLLIVLITMIVEFSLGVYKKESQ